MGKLGITTFILVSFSLACQQVWGLSAGISGYSGNPNTNGGGSCEACHSGGTAPSLNLNGPLTLEAGTTAEYTLSMSGGQENTAGLNISAGSGSLSSSTTSIVLNNNELVHAQAISVGTAATNWVFNFTAPVTAGNVTLYAAVLSGDNDATFAGDGVATISLNIEVTPAQKPLPPSASAGGPYFAQPATQIQFDASASADGDGTIERYLWDFGDGSPFVIGESVSHSYDTEGTYTVTVAVTDNDKLTGAAAATVTINANIGSPEGQALYNQHCYICHGTGGAGGTAVAVIGATAEQITNAIPLYPDMASILLTPEEIQLIADFLIVGGGEPPPRPTDGPGLYAMFCGACHGADGRGGTAIGVTGSTLPMVSDAITNIAVMQTIDLNLDEQQLVADFLVAGGSGDIPADGAGLYQVFCEVCHGAGGHGGKFLAVTGAPAAMINSAIANQPWMNDLSLTSTQLNAIGNYLSAGGSGPLPSDGAGLYGVFCGVCHGPDGRGGIYKIVTGTSVGFINDALSNENLMQSLQLNSGDISSIADYLAAGGGGDKPTDGAGLYQVYCETCHGPNGSGGPEENVVGASQGEINSAISGENDMQQLWPYLSRSGSSSDTARISDFLNR